MPYRDPRQQLRYWRRWMKARRDANIARGLRHDGAPRLLPWRPRVESARLDREARAWIEKQDRERREAIAR